MRANNRVGVQFLLWASILITACAPKSLAPKALIAWVEDEANGLKQSKTIPPVVLVAQFQPSAYLLAKELQKDTSNQANLEEQNKSLAGLQYFQLQLSIDSKDPQNNITNYLVADDAEYQKRMHYLAFDMQKDIVLVEGQDTLPCVLFHFERSSDLSPKRTFLVAFKDKNASQKKDKTLIVNALKFASGIIKIYFSATNLAKIPTLKSQS